jgi:AbrB family looped-hinge helix DNA binding protein
MAIVQFRLQIGAKRQVTIPKGCMDMLSLEEGGELLLEVMGDHAILLPVVSIPRRDLPENLRKRFQSRRGAKPSDIPLAKLLDDIGYKPLREPSAAVDKKIMSPLKARKTPPAPLKMR